MSATSTDGVLICVALTGRDARVPKQRLHIAHEHRCAEPGFRNHQLPGQAGG